MFLELAFNLPLDKTFHYSLPDTLSKTGAVVGRRVLAPFGPRSLVGFIVGVQEEKPSFPTKPIYRFLDDGPFLNETMMTLALWISGRYLSAFGEALAAMVSPTLMEPKKPAAESGAAQEKDEPLKLSTAQAGALEPLAAAVAAHQFKPFLIRGITDSGKTEIYLQTMDRVLAKGRQALFLLPEIALTPPFYDRLKARYGNTKVGLWHSGISEGERYKTWDGARRGDLRVILGARSAVFAPFPNLGLIVLDEEHEATYKQEDRPRYHTREVALKRAELTSSVLLMGSATPSMESYWKAKEGVYTLLEMTSRIEERQLPPVELIDRRPGAAANQSGGKPEIRQAGTAVSGSSHEENLSPPLGSAASRVSRRSDFSIFSEPLRLAIEQRLARKEQILLFVNRRGFTPFLRCSKCGWVARCERCSMTLTLHHADKSSESQSPYMQCHTCSQRQKVSIQCPQCKSMKVRQYGSGTQKIEEELKKLYPFVKLGRLDKDIASKKQNHEKIYRAFANRELDVLVGTQMIAKGFHFPAVTLVGVVDADVSLHLPDFRAAERTFSLLTQVAGRTGRGKERGLVYVQTHHPDHYALEAAKEHDYLRFYEREITDRKTLGYPPYTQLVNVVLRATKEEAAQAAAQAIYDKLEAMDTGASLLGPSPAPYSKMRGQFRYQVLIKGDDKSLEQILVVLKHWKPRKAYMAVDVDPSDLL